MNGSIQQILRCGLALPRTLYDLGCSLKLWWLRPCRESREKQLTVVRRVNSGHIAAHEPCLLYPQKRMFITRKACPQSAKSGHSPVLNANASADQFDLLSTLNCRGSV